MGTVPESDYIAKCLATRKEPGKRYALYENCEGTVLFDYINRSRGTSGARSYQKNVQRYFAMAVIAVLVLHGAGISHGDIKPHNFVITNMGKPKECLKLIDFSNTAPSRTDFGTDGYVPPEGLECSMSPKSSDDSSCCYQSPKISKKESIVHSGKEQDIWALGIMFYMLTTGCHPSKSPFRNSVFGASQQQYYRDQQKLDKDFGCKFPLQWDYVDKQLFYLKRKRILSIRCFQLVGKRVT